ncbi:MAG: hypothetical protein ACYDCK_00990 [Thermoplasmatota archaeon]
MPTRPSATLLAAIAIVVASFALVTTFTRPGLDARTPGTTNAAPSGFTYNASLGTSTYEGKSAAQVDDRYAGLVLRQPPGDETAGLVVDMSGRSELYNDGIYVYTDSKVIDHTAGIQVQNDGAADAMHVNLGCRGCPGEVNAPTNTGIGIDQWSNGTGFFTFVHGNGRGLDSVLYPSATGAWAGSFRAASNRSGSGELVHVDTADNPNVRAVEVVHGESDLQLTRFHGDVHLEREVGDDTLAVRFAQSQHHAPGIDANGGWLRVIDSSANDQERFLIEARTGNVRFTGHVGAGPDDGLAIANATGSIVLAFKAAYQSTPVIGCTAHGALVCTIVAVSDADATLQLYSLQPGGSVAGAVADIVVRGT